MTIVEHVSRVDLGEAICNKSDIGRILTLIITKLECQAGITVKMI